MSCLLLCHPFRKDKPPEKSLAINIFTPNFYRNAGQKGTR